MAALATVRWALPQDWLGWAHGDRADAERRSSLHGDDGVRRGVVAAVRSFEDMISTELPGTACAALWFPEPADPTPHASAVLRSFSLPRSDEPRLERVLERARADIPLPPGVRLLDVAALPSQVAAGDAVLQIVDTAPRFRRRVSREWSWFILPPDTEDLVLVHVESSSIAHFDQLADMSTDIANAVEVTLESP